MESLALFVDEALSRCRSLILSFNNISEITNLSSFDKLVLLDVRCTALLAAELCYLTHHS